LRNRGDGRDRAVAAILPGLVSSAERVERIAGWLRRAFAQFREDGCLNLAGAISYFTLLSIVPAIVLFISGVAFLVRRSEGITETVIAGLRSYFPFLPEAIVKQADELVRHAGTFSWVALLFLLITSEMVFGAIHGALNRVFRARRRFLTSKVFSLLLILAAGLVLSFNLAVTALVSADYVVMPRSLARIWSVIGGSFLLAYALPFVLMALVFTAAFKLIPNRRVRLRAAAGAGVFGAVLWEAGKHLFAWYVESVAQYSAIYGSLATLVVGLIWVHLSASIFLFSAELAAVVNREIEEREAA
jgi:membrane protein